MKYLLLVQRLDLCWRSLLLSGRDMLVQHVTWATPPGTGNAGDNLQWGVLADPVASSGSAEPSQRAQRGGPPVCWWLKVRANPLGNQARVIRPDRSRHMGMIRLFLGSLVKVGKIVDLASFLEGHFPALNTCCDALRCSGPHARYTDRASEYITLAERSG